MNANENTNTDSNIPTITIAGTENPMIDQAAGMMVQDMQSFLQGSEQIMMVAIAKAAKMATSPDKTENAPGIAALAAFQTFMPLLPEFATEIGQSANDIISGKYPTGAANQEEQLLDNFDDSLDKLKAAEASVSDEDKLREARSDSDKSSKKSEHKKPPFLSFLIPGIILLGTSLLVLIY